MAALALALYAIHATITFGARVGLQLRRTGSTGLHGLPPGAGTIDWVAGGLFIAGLGLVAVGLFLDLMGAIGPIVKLDGAGGHLVGILLAVAGIFLTFGAQLAMGDSWRVGVDPGERTELVTSGPFAHVRNPIYSAMLPMVFGLVLMVPNVVVIAGFLALFVGLELQVRLVEEPYLQQVHGDAYAAYAARVGRFVPRLGLLHGALAQILALLGTAMALTLLAPVPASALDSDLKGFAVFNLQASHGYSILGIASSERLDGSGVIDLIVYRKGAVVSYVARATVTPDKLEADLGSLGRVSAEILPGRVEKTLRSRCGGGSERVAPRLYRGTFEFHGEESFTDAVATEVPESPQVLLNLSCPGVTSGELSSPKLPGARLLVRRHDRSLWLRLNKNRPDKTAIFSATLFEMRNGIRIERSVSGRQPARAFEYGPLLRTATIAPVAPFSGAARFDRRAGADRWTGNLSLDFPGERHVPLAGASFSVHLVHARRS
jgi:protein-S-isoprenylcysteine O-methyltransferase Ste14